MSLSNVLRWDFGQQDSITTCMLLCINHPGFEVKVTSSVVTDFLHFPGSTSHPNRQNVTVLCFSVFLWILAFYLEGSLQVLYNHLSCFWQQAPTFNLAFSSCNNLLLSYISSEFCFCFLLRCLPPQIYEKSSVISSYSKFKCVGIAKKTLYELTLPYLALNCFDRLILVLFNIRLTASHILLFLLACVTQTHFCLL